MSVVCVFQVHGRDLSHLQKREAFRILASYEQPITLQIEGRGGRSLQYNRTMECSTQTERAWDPLRLHSCTVPRPPHSDRYDTPAPLCCHLQDKHRIDYHVVLLKLSFILDCLSLMCMKLLAKVMRECLV